MIRIFTALSLMLLTVVLSAENEHNLVERHKERSLIVLAAPSVRNLYYKLVFRQIINYMSAFVKKVQGKDDIVILVDQQTQRYFRGKVPRKQLIKAKIEDIWIRDFGPVIPTKQIKFLYKPNYQTTSITSLIDQSFRSWFSDNDLCYRNQSNIIVDGGNIVDNTKGSRIVLTDRILLDNPQLDKAQAKLKLKQLMGVEEVAIIPELDGDTTGHSDGMLMWVSDNKILIHETPEPYRSNILAELRESFPGINIVEIPDYYEEATWNGFTSACNVYVNSIVTDEYIYMPTFASEHDKPMHDLIQSHTKKKLVTIPAEKVCFMGGSVRCLSWQVKGDLKKQILDLVD